jgi:hypothetical protein
MNPTVARLLRALTVIVFVVAGVLAYQAFRGEDTKPEVAELGASERTVPQAMATPGTAPLTVRGYVFDGGGTGLRLCSGRIRHDPPRCQGPFLDLYGVDRGMFDLEQGRDLGRTVYWSSEPIALYGTLIGTRMDVTQIFR